MRAAAAVLLAALALVGLTLSAASGTAAAECSWQRHSKRVVKHVRRHERVRPRPTVHAGEVTVELNNQGQDPHNLNIRREGDEGEPLQIPETDSLQHQVAKFDLAPGTYQLWCSLPEHDEKGMHTTLVVE